MSSGSRVLLLIAMLAGCTPTFNWREVSVEPAGLQSLFPCKPQKSRRAAAGGAGPESELLSCRAAQWTFAVAYSSLGTGTDPGRALAAMRSALLANTDGRETRSQRITISGTSGEAIRLAIRGRSAGGAPIELQAQLFAHGGTVVQASILGSSPVAAEVADSFFESLRWVGPPLRVQPEPTRPPAPG